MPKQGSRRTRISPSQIALLVGALLWAYVVLTKGLANVLARADPQLATQLDSSNAEALGQNAYRRMIAAANQDDVRAVNSLSRQALVQSPLQVGALRNLGFLAEFDKKPAKARALMMAAADVSRRDALTQAWLFTDYKNSGQVAKAVEAADIVMRMKRAYRDLMIAELLKISKDDRFVEPMVKALAARPEWRLKFLQQLNDPNADSRNIYRVLSALKAQKSAPSTEELTSYFARFDGSENPARLWAEWQSLTPSPEARKGLIRDGGFEGLDAPIPYNWTLFVAPGVYAEREACPDGCPGKVLYLSYDGNIRATFAKQMLALTPGRYRLAFRVYSEGADVSPMTASILCGGGASATTIASKAFSAREGKWVTNRLEFDVPRTCPGQQLFLSGSRTISSDTMSAWLDNVTLDRIDARTQGGDDG